MTGIENKYKIFHIGIPKSGTTTIQKTLANDSRLKVTRSRLYTSGEWWLSNGNKEHNDKILVESNETIISGGFQKVKLPLVIERLYKTNKEAHIILTVRKQEMAILSMYKYHIKYNFEGVKSLSNWMYNTDLGVDYLSICMYGNIAKLLLNYFSKENIHFLFFEELKDDPLKFYTKFYKALGITFKEEYMMKNPMNVMKFSNDELYTLTKINKWSFTKNNSNGLKRFKRIHSLENKIKRGIVKRISFKTKSDFFNLKKIEGYDRLLNEFKSNNKMLVDLGLVEKEELIKYNYPI